MTVSVKSSVEDNYVIDIIHIFLFQPCEVHQSGGRTRKILGVGGGGLGGIDNQQRVLGHTWSKIKTAASTLKEKVREIRLILSYTP